MLTENNLIQFKELIIKKTVFLPTNKIKQSFHLSQRVQVHVYRQLDLQRFGHHPQVADVVDAPDGSVGPRVVVPPQHAVLHLRGDALRLHERLRLVLKLLVWKR